MSRDRSGRAKDKDTLALLDEVMWWEDFDATCAIRERLVNLFGDGADAAHLPRSLLHRLIDIATQDVAPAPRTKH
jgi:hypothetical protein